MTHTERHSLGVRGHSLASERRSCRHVFMHRVPAFSLAGGWVGFDLWNAVEHPDRLGPSDL